MPSITPGVGSYNVSSNNLNKGAFIPSGINKDNYNNIPGVGAYNPNLNESKYHATIG